MNENNIGANKDHPRSRGVYPTTTCPTRLSQGSSPLARGLRYNPLSEFKRGGIIPARAGFTRRSRQLFHGAGDHPRSRGVYSGSRSYPQACRGSSPLARGLLSLGTLLIKIGRIIPARAGFTAPRRPSSGRSRDHPRSRGVYIAGSEIFHLVSGSSPLARGLLSGEG